MRETIEDKGNGIIYWNSDSCSNVYIVFALGLGSTEYSPYAIDIIHHLREKYNVISIRGQETIGNNFSQETIGNNFSQETINKSHEKINKFFIKTDISRIINVVNNLDKDDIVIGIGVSLGGALMMQAAKKLNDRFKKIIIISASFHYEHAIKTMNNSLLGYITNKIIVYWQFKCMYNNYNFLHYLHDNGQINFITWIQLFFSSNILEHDKLLCDLYNINYEEYIEQLDLRKIFDEIDIDIHYLVSYNDPMFSKEHFEHLENFIEEKNMPNFHSTFTHIGTHAYFTVKHQNDYLFEYLDNVI